MAKLKLSFIIYFILAFLCISFFIGTFSFALIVQNFIEYMRETGWLAGYENAIVILTITATIIFSLFFTKWFLIWFRTTKKTSVRVFIVLIIFIPSIVAFFSWLHTERNTSAVSLMSLNKNFVTGPYPSEQQLFQLKSQGFTGVISLLSPYVAPIEPILLAKEKKLVEKAGLKFINIPMVPWVSRNTSAIKEIQQLVARTQNEKYYVNCYYGRDRVRLFIKYVDIFSGANRKIISSSSEGKVEKISFERGVGFLINDSILFAPMPTQDEFFLLVSAPNARFLQSVENVISINPHFHPNVGEGQELKSFLQSVNGSFEVMPYLLEPFNPRFAFEILQQAQEKIKLGRVLIYDFFMPPKSARIEAVLSSLISKLPTVPVALIKTPLLNGGINRIAPNILIGPEPTVAEFDNRLVAIGVEKVAYLGFCKTKQALISKSRTTSAKLKWACSSTKSANKFLSELEKDRSIWYIYGPGLEKVRSSLEKHFEPSLKSLEFMYSS